jgi:hypothetical protein
MSLGVGYNPWRCMAVSRKGLDWGGAAEPRQRLHGLCIPTTRRVVHELSQARLVYFRVRAACHWTTLFGVPFTLPIPQGR